MNDKIIVNNKIINKFNIGDIDISKLYLSPELIVYYGSLNKSIDHCFKIIFNKEKSNMIISYLDKDLKLLDYIFTVIFNLFVKENHKGPIILYDNYYNNYDFNSPFFRYGFKYDIEKYEKLNKNKINKMKLPMIIDNFYEYKSRFGFNNINTNKG
jgi:hypothetical protein